MKYLNILFILFIMDGHIKSQQPVSTEGEETAKAIIEMEKRALDLWINGNPDGFLELSADDVIYIDPYFEQKLEGRKALETCYNNIRGQVSADSYEMIKPVVQLTTDCAVLTYNFISTGGGQTFKWNCTEVFRLNAGNKWEIIHTHWSLVKPLPQ